MAIENAKVLNVRIRNKYDSYENWATSALVLDPGELAIAYTTVNVDVGNGKIEKHPELLMKVGDGAKTFANLPWVSAKAADVAAWAKAAEKPEYQASEITGMEKYIADYVKDEMGISVDTDTQYQIVKVDDYNYKLQSKGKSDEAWADVANSVIVIPNDTAAIEALQGLVGDKKVATQISEAIAALDLANTYDAKGAAAAVQTALDTYKTANDAAVLANTNNITANANAITAIKDGTTIDSFKDVEEALAGKETAGAAAQALADAKAHAEGLAGNYDEKGAAAQALADAKAHAEGLAVNYDAAGSAAAAETAAKAHTDAEMARLVGDTPVGTQITTAITNLDLGNTYDAKGAAAAAETAAKSHADGLNTAMNTRVEALEAIDHDHANKTVLDGITAEKVAAWDAAEQNAKDHADDLDEAMDLRMQAVEAKLGTGEGGVDAQIAAAVAAEAKLREEADAGLQEQITANDGEILALQGLVGDKKVSEAIEAAVKVETDRATGVEGGLETRLAAVEADYLTSTDKEALQVQINTIMSNPDAEGAINSINEFTQYVKDHGTIAEGMRTDINKNKEDIAAEVTRATGVESGLDTRLTAVEGAVATKAAQADHEALAGRVTTVEGKVTTLEGEMDEAQEAIAALEELVGDENVSDQISDAIDGALKVDGVEKYALATALTEAVGQHNTDKAALEAEIAKKANTADLADIAFSGSTDDLVQGELVLVFDCGTSAV